MKFIPHPSVKEKDGGWTCCHWCKLMRSMLPEDTKVMHHRLTSPSELSDTLQLSHMGHRGQDLCPNIPVWNLCMYATQTRILHRPSYCQATELTFRSPMPSILVMRCHVLNMFYSCLYIWWCVTLSTFLDVTFSGSEQRHPRWKAGERPAGNGCEPRHAFGREKVSPWNGRKTIWAFL